MPAPPTAPARPVSHPVFARVYDRLSRWMEPRGMGEHRTRLLAGLSGRVVEIGAGNGLNLRHYPPGVDQVTAVEPEAYLRAAAQRAAAAAPVATTVVDATAEALPAGDATFDAAVASLMLCSVDDQQPVLAELFRVLRPGGQLRFLEHVAARTPVLAATQRALDATIWPWFGGGCHTGRDTVAAISAAGFELEQIERFRLPDGPLPAPTAPHALGTARRPGPAGPRPA